jgi:hypothetical protein
MIHDEGNIQACWRHMESALRFMKTGLEYRLRQDQAAKAKQQQAMNQWRQQAEYAQGQAQKAWGDGTKCSDDMLQAGEAHAITPEHWKQDLNDQVKKLLETAVDPNQLRQWRAERPGCGMTLTATNAGFVRGSNPYAIPGVQYDPAFCNFVLTNVLPKVHSFFYPIGSQNPGGFDWKFTLSPQQ